MRIYCNLKNFPEEMIHQQTTDDYSSPSASLSLVEMTTWGNHGLRVSVVHSLRQGSPNPSLWTAIGPQPVGDQAAQQEVSCRQESEASSAARHRSPWLPTTRITV